MMTTVRSLVVVSILYHPQIAIVALTRLNHVLAGIYMYVPTWMPPPMMSTYNKFSWETVFTASFELDALRGKRPYRWTIWVSRRC
jgi:hypothetical protein